MIAIAASLPRTSKARKKLSGLIIDTLWKSLQHPPLSYFGNQYQYRTPDGSYNVSWTRGTQFNIHLLTNVLDVEPSPAELGQGWKSLRENRPEVEAHARCPAGPWSSVRSYVLLFEV